MTNEKLIESAERTLRALKNPPIDDSEELLFWLATDGVEIIEDWLEGNQDTKRLNFLQEMNDKARYTGKVVFRWSQHGRGWRLHETSRPEAVTDVRLAIDKAMGKENDNR